MKKTRKLSLLGYVVVGVLAYILKLGASSGVVAATSSFSPEPVTDTTTLAVKQALAVVPDRRFAAAQSLVQDDQLVTRSKIVAPPAAAIGASFNYQISPGYIGSLEMFQTCQTESKLTAKQAKDSREAVTSALNQFQLTPIQRLSVRDYVGEGKATITEFRTTNGEMLIIRDAKTGDYLGEAQIKAGPDGSIAVSKLIGAQFDHKAEYEVPALGIRSEEAQKVIDGKESLSTFESKKPEGDGLKIKIPGIEIDPTKGELSATIAKLDVSAKLGSVSESTAVFQKDGHGYEYGLRTSLAEVSAGASAGAGGGEGLGAGSIGVKGEIGAKGPSVETYVNYLGAPDADAKGEFTRSVIGVSGEAHGTLANAEGELGYFEQKGFEAKASVGALGIGLGGGVNYSPVTKISVKPEIDGGEGGIAGEDAADASTVGDDTNDDSADDDDAKENISGQERAAYEAAERDGSIEALDDFLETYPDSVYADDVREDDESKGGDPPASADAAPDTSHADTQPPTSTGDSDEDGGSY